jgi:predicted secreted protein
MIRRLLLALAGAVCATAAFAQPPIEPRFNQVDLQAEVAREVQNDLMNASLYVEAGDPSAAKVADQLNRVSAEALKTAGEFKAVRARSGYTQTYPVYDRANKLSGWRGRSEIRLESKDVQAMAGLIGRLQSTMQLGGVSFTVSPELRRQTENDLITDAVAAFRARGHRDQGDRRPQLQDPPHRPQHRRLRARPAPDGRGPRDGAAERRGRAADLRGRDEHGAGDGQRHRRGRVIASRGVARGDEGG